MRKYKKFGLMIMGALMGMIQMATAGAILVDGFADSNPTTYMDWQNAGITEDVSDGMGGNLFDQAVYNQSGLLMSQAGSNGKWDGGVYDPNQMLSSYIYMNNATASMSFTMSGFETAGVANTMTSSLGDMAGNTFTLLANQDYKLYLFGSGNADGQNSAFTYDGVTKVTTDAIAGTAANAGHFVTFDLSTGADLTGFGVDFTVAQDGAGTAAFNGLALVAVPEPATIGLFALFGSGILLLRRRLVI